MEVKAILYDGHKKLPGELILDDLGIHFILSDFDQTDLGFDIKFEDVENVRYHKIFDLQVNGIQIKTKKGGENVFVLDDPNRVKEQIDIKVKRASNLKNKKPAI